MIIRVRVIPNSYENEVVGRVGSVVRVKVCSPEVSQESNQVLIQYLAEFSKSAQDDSYHARGKSPGKNRPHHRPFRR